MHSVGRFYRAGVGYAPLDARCSSAESEWKIGSDGAQTATDEPNAPGRADRCQRQGGAETRHERQVSAENRPHRPRKARPQTAGRISQTDRRKLDLVARVQ